MAKNELFLQEVILEQGNLAVIINCGPSHPGKLEDIRPGHRVYDFARQILHGRLIEAKWITPSGEPIGCDLDLRSMIGQNEDTNSDYVFCLACLKFPLGTIDPENDSFRRLAPDEMASDSQPDSFKVYEEPAPELEVIEDPDTKGKHTIDDLLAGL